MQEVFDLVELLSGLEGEHLIALLSLACMGVCAMALAVIHSIVKDKK